MLYTIAVILLLMWLLGLVSGYTASRVSLRISAVG